METSSEFRLSKIGIHHPNLNLFQTYQKLGYKWLIRKNIIVLFNGKSTHWSFEVDQLRAEADRCGGKTLNHQPQGKKLKNYQPVGERN